ncbi:MAG: hypothetical protein QM778_35180 [Myxococcales bacterium]
MSDDEELAIHEAVDAALNELAERLGGSSDTGGPVENATQIKGRGDLGVLLTDAQDRVLGRVWISFGAGVQVPNQDLASGGNVHVQAEVCSEIIEPPLTVDAWLNTLSKH